MTATDTSLRQKLIAAIAPAWVVDFRATIYSINGAGVEKVITSTLTNDTDVIALEYDGYEEKEPNEDGSFPAGEPDTVELYKLSFRIDRTAGQSADDAVGLFHLLRRYLRDDQSRRYIWHEEIPYRITLGNGAVIPNPDAGFDTFEIPIQLS